MKFSTLLVLALTYATLASAQAQSPNDFRPKNADDAEKLQKQFDQLNENSPCANNDQACVNKQFAQCVNGKFTLTACASGLECAALPLVNKPGTTVACTTETDRLARLADARGGNAKGNDNTGKDPTKSPDGQPDNVPKKSKKPKNDQNIKEPDNQPNGKDGKNPKANDPKVKDPKVNDPKVNDPKVKDPKVKDPKVNDPKVNDPKVNDPKVKDPKVKDPKVKDPKANDPNNGAKPKTPKEPTGNIADIRKKNADDAEKLQKQFDQLNENSPCTNNDQACVNKQFAQCVNGKFALTSCGNGQECAALPLVLKPGTSITCTTEADRVARIDQARKNL